MNLMGYEELLEEELKSGQDKLYEENFLKDPELSERLEQLNRNIKTELSGQYEEITIERLTNDQLKAVEELREIEEKYPDILKGLT